jgi:hypothetical protein
MPAPLLALYGLMQAAYLAALLVVLWLYTRAVDLVDTRPEAFFAPAGTDVKRPDPTEIILFYPVLDELESTMRTTMLGFERSEFPGGRRRVVAIPNADDLATIASLRSIQQECSFLEILPVPSTEDDSWNAVWAAWEANEKVYWWHSGKRRHERALPPKKTRQLVYAFYTMATRSPDALLSYIDADSVVPEDYFRTAVVGMRSYDVIQNTNVAGNLLGSWASTMFAMDHMAWDGSLYQHMSARGRHPFYVLGKGLFFRVSDLIEVGGFNPWLTIEDPEVGMRLWTNGRRLGIVRSPLVEEVPDTFGRGVTQRKRWVAGFFQSLAAPLRLMGMNWRQRQRARLNLVPCMSLMISPLGLAIGIAALVATLTSSKRVLDVPLEVLSIATIAATVIVIGIGQLAALRMSAIVLRDRRERAKFMARVNPIFLFAYWLWWAVPMVIGFWMFLGDRGQRWERTTKIDANHDLIRDAQLEPERERELVA